MRNLFFAVCLTLAAAYTAYAADFNRAEQLYRQGHFASALAEYEELLSTYPNDPFLYYNIGNCYFKMGVRGLAAANYYRAFRLAPRDPDIRHNLTLALESAGERFVPSGMPQAMHQAFFGLRTDELKGLFILSLWLFCTTASVWLVKRRFGRAALAAALILALLGGWYAWRKNIEGNKLAVVAAPVAELRSGPGNNFPANANAVQGRLVIIEDARDNWYEVVVKSEGIKGWTEANSLEII